MPKAIPFEEANVNLCGLISIIGKTKSGKTTLLRSLINQLMKKGLFRTYVFSSTAEIYRYTDYDFCLPQNVRKIDMKKIREIKARQEVLAVKATKDKRVEPKWIAIVLDDFIGDEQCNLLTKIASVISSLAVSGRHYKICTIILSQHLNKLPPVVRLQSTYIFVTKCNMSTIMDGIYPLQTDITDKKTLWRMYTEHTKTRYASVMFQADDPYDDNIKFLGPAKKVSFIDDVESVEILNDLKEDSGDSNNSSDDKTSFEDDGGRTGEDSILSLTDSIGSGDDGIL